MKKISFFITGVIAIILLVVAISLINKKEKIIVESFDSNVVLSLGKYKAKKINSKNDYEIRYYCYEIEKMEEEIKKLDTYVDLIDNNYIFYSEGYYFVGSFSESILTIKNMINRYYDFFFPCFTDYRLITYSRLLDGCYYNEYTYKEIAGFENNYLKINSKEALIDFYKNINDDYAYYDANADKIYIKIFNESEYNIFIKLEVEGIKTYARR